MTEEYTEPSDDRDGDRRRSAWLSWAVLAIVFVVVIWVFLHYGQVPASSGSRTSNSMLTAATVPNVVGMTGDAATEMLKRAGFVAEVDSAFSSKVTPGTVASQKPRAGTKLVKGGLVVVVVAFSVGSESGTAEGMEAADNRVPSVVGLTELRADELLENDGYNLSCTGGYTKTRPRGVIYSQSPEPGEISPLGSTVEAKMSLGPPPPGQVQVPDTIGMTPYRATQALKVAGLDPRSMIQWRDGSSGIVFQQDPAPGVLAAEGSRVFILSGE
ncbi:MAG: hypothetical protein CVT67_09615 [Actinobacteria bacterium HGW-Actinobacteria-7]|nr:MAG: hypothetical protein CVT67_09615 [Actinobacteria bacterium HGW-Actinobacteria-7]